MKSHRRVLHLVAVFAAMGAGPVLAQSRCDQLGNWASCLETQASSAASATVAFTDGYNEHITPSGSYADNTPTVRRLNVEVQQVPGRMMDLLGGSEAMSFPRSRIEFIGDPVAFLLR